MLLENNNYSHLQRSIDTLRSLGDRLGERNVDFRLNLHQDRALAFDRNTHHLNNSLLDRNNGINSAINNSLFEKNMFERNPLERSPPPQMDRNNLGGNPPPNHVMLDRNNQILLERNTSLLMDPNRSLELMQERGLERLINERTLTDHRTLEHSLNLERLNLERSLAQHDRALTDRNLNHIDRLRNGLDMNSDNSSRNDINENAKYRDYKVHLDNLRNTDSSRSGEGREGEERGAPPTPPTPLSDNSFNEEKVFSSKAELQLHTQAHMREAKPYKCSQCCKAFANSSYLSQHTRIHLGIKPYRCEICQRKFTQLSHLQQHIRTHTGDKPYKCRHPGCQKAFSQLSNLQSHSRCHQTDKPYKCNSCYKCFSDEPSLLEHIPKHKESKHLKTHICQYCGKSYTQETYLSKHMQKHAERTDKRPPIGPPLGLNHRGLEHPYWPKVSPDSAENLHDFSGDMPRNLLEQNEDLVIIRQQLQNPPAPPSTPNTNLSNAYDTSISKATTNSAFTPINSMSGHLNLNHHQLAPNRPYIYDALSFQKQNSLDLPKSQPSNGFPNQLISLHQIRNYAHQPNTSLMEHSLLGIKDK